jgi:hypothetical protein
VSTLTDLSDKKIGEPYWGTSCFGIFFLFYFWLAFFWLSSFSESLGDPY